MLANDEIKQRLAQKIWRRNCIALHRIEARLMKAPCKSDSNSYSDHTLDQLFSKQKLDNLRSALRQCNDLPLRTQIVHCLSQDLIDLVASYTIYLRLSQREPSSGSSTR